MIFGMYRLSLYFLFVTCFGYVRCATYSDATSLYTHITGSVNKYLLPADDQSVPKNITMEFYLKSVVGLDEVNGILTTVMSLGLSWTDDTIYWDPSSYGNMHTIKLDGSLIWMPIFSTSNPSKKIARIGLPNIPVTIEDDGQVIYSAGDLLETTCDVDVTYFPFDTQNCVIELFSLGYESDIRLILKTTGNDASCIYLTVFSENNLWTLKATKCEIAYLALLPYAKLTLSLERRYAFFILNLFSPVLIMSVLNLMVFMLPPESGERVGYAITCLLALSVYMTFASESLPVSSKPIPILIYLLLSIIVLSSTICFEVIMGLKIHMHEDSPKPPKILTKVFFFRCKRSRAVHVTDDEEKVKYKEKDDKDDKDDKDEEITWKQLGHRFDMLCFVFNFLGTFLMTITYLIVVRNGG